ncbi:SGNH/GDSL hydrolase family protein [Nocardioides marmoraquaticus]
MTCLGLLVTACSPGADGGEPVAEPPAAAPSAAGGPTTYVALGDSYTSAPFVPLTDVAGGCFRSDTNYPSLVAEALGAELTDVSCAGADTTDVRSRQLRGVPPQAQAVTPEAQLVTVALGGNDGGVFSTLVGQCGRPGAPSRCARELTASDESRLAQRLERTSDDLLRTLRLVQRRAPDAQVLAVGYPTIVSADRGCEALPLSDGTRRVAARLNTALNDAVRSAAERAGVTYVDVAEATADHDICADEPWVNGADTDQQRALAFHPFAEEQQAVADAVLAAVDR